MYGRRKDGTEFPADIMLGPVEMAEGRVVLSVIRDLSEKREAEEALRKSELQKRYLEEELNTEAQFAEIIGRERWPEARVETSRNRRCDGRYRVDPGRDRNGQGTDRPGHSQAEPGRGRRS